MIAASKHITNVLSTERFEQLLEKFKQVPPVLILGDVGIDRYTLGEVTRISPEAPVPVLNVLKNWNKLGLAANVAENLKTMDVKSTLCCVLGKDEHANVFETLLEEIGHSTWGIIHDAKRPTTLKERITTSGQQICRVDYEKSGAIDAEIEAKLYERILEFLPKHGAVIIEDYDKGSLTPALLDRIIAKSKEKKILVAVDPARHRSALIYRGADLLKPNLAEAKLLVQSLGLRAESPSELCQILLDKLNLQMIALTLGAEGMCLMDRQSGEKGLRIIPTLATEVFDVSGAGDTVIATLVSVLLAEGTLEEAAWLANCAAGVVVSKKGTATVDQKELRDFYARMKNKFGH
jgi:rfaE bifunctional protein kinase chain/domain